MSIALDLNLYIRDKNIQLKLDIQGFLYTLAFYVGSNAKAWVSQTELADHLGMSLSGIKKQMRKAKETGLLIAEKNPRNPKSNLYRFSEFLINYHQHRVPDKVRKLSTKVPYKEPENPSLVPDKVPNKYPTRYLSGSQKNAQTRATPDIANVEKPPKGTYKATYKSKETVKSPSVLQLSKSKKPWTKETFGFDQRQREEAVRRDIDIQVCFNKFIHWLEGKGRYNFEQKEWDIWFAKERDGKNVKKQEDIDYSGCSVCKRPNKYCSCATDNMTYDRELARKEIAKARQSLKPKYLQ